MSTVTVSLETGFSWPGEEPSSQPCSSSVFVAVTRRQIERALLKFGLMRSRERAMQKLVDGVRIQKEP